jgi:hypothetical protein
VPVYAALLTKVFDTARRLGLQGRLVLSKERVKCPDGGLGSRTEIWDSVAVGQALPDALPAAA